MTNNSIPTDGSLAFLQGLIGLPVTQRDDQKTIHVYFINESFSKAYPIEREDLLKLDYFKELLDNSYADSIFISDCSSTELMTLLDLIANKITLWEIFSEQELDDPKLLFSIEKLVKRFSPKDLPLLIEQFKYLSCSAAENVLTLHEESIREEKEVEETDLVSIAKQIILDSIFFESPEAADKCKNETRLLSKEIEWIERKIHKHSSRRSDSSKYHQEVLSSTINEFTKKRIEFEKKLFALAKTQETSMMQRQFASKYIESKHQHVRAAAEQAVEELEAYKEQIQQTLIKGGAKNRPDLMAYLIGPSAYLLDEYGLTLSTSDVRKEYPFSFTGEGSICRTNFGYRLENDSAFDLEEELRSDVSRYMKQIPDRIIKTKVITLPIDEAIAEQRVEMLAILSTWSTTSDENVKKLKDFIIERGGWGEFGITDKDIKISVPYEKNPFKLKGTLTKFGRSIEFYFNTYSFLPIIDHGPTADSLSSKTYLSELSNPRTYQYAPIPLLQHRWFQQLQGDGQAHCQPGMR